MKVLVVDDDAACARSICTALSRAGHDVETVQDGRSAQARLATTVFDVCVVDWMLPDLDGTALVRQLRTEKKRQPGVLMVSGLVGPLARSHALRVGADELLAKPFTPVGLTNAISGVRQAAGRRNAHAAQDVSVCTESMAGLLQTSAWKEIVETARLAIADFVGIELAVSPLATEPPIDAIGSTLVMVDVEHMVDLGVAVFASRAGGSGLAYQMLGETHASDSVVVDLLTEACNNVLGRAKTAMRGDGHLFTLALNDGKRLADYATFCKAWARVVTARFSADGVDIDVVVGAGDAPAVSVLVNRLEENMVTAESLFTDAGMLLLPSGARLTATAVERLQQHLPNRLVRVCALAAA